MINVFELAADTQLELTDGRFVTVTENMEDGMWVSVREGESEETELIHAQDILRVAQN